jgi:hypothetical protein
MDSITPSTTPKKHTLPAFLNNQVDPSTYEKWLNRKAKTHVKRDRKRDHICRSAAYREAIHAAVNLSDGKDAYTNEVLDWSLISTYRNEDSKQGRHAYKSRFALLPTVDHVSADATKASFRICSWRTNDAKGDLSIESFLDLCARILTHNGYRLEKLEASNDSIKSAKL